MFSDKEREELIRDAKDPKRRAEYAKVKSDKPVSKNLDEYIDFLMQLQTIFGPFEISREPTVMKINKIL